MKLGFGIQTRIQNVYTHLNLFRFWLRKCLLGFDIANQFLRRVDKNAIKIILKRNGATIGKDCDIETGLTFHNCRDYSNLSLGNNCHIGKNCFFDLRSKVHIEENVVISMQSMFITHQDINKSDLRVLYPASTAAIYINKNCYIGTGVTILQGVQLGESSVIAAGSIVTKNVEPYTMVGGVPAKFIKALPNIEKHQEDAF